MTKSKYCLIALLTAILLSVVLGSSSAFASDTSSTNQAEPTISVLNAVNELKKNNLKALSLIEVSNVPLTEAQTIAVKQRQELNEAKTTIDKLTTELDKAKADLVKQVTLNEMQNSLTELKGKSTATREPSNDYGCSATYLRWWGGAIVEGNTSMNER
ncbi:MAG: hypothetical protein ACLRZ2_00190 [Veillonella sp.]